MLTDMQLKKAKAADKEYKLPDSGGLHLNVSTTGHRSWRLKYRFGKEEKLLTIGSYPEIWGAEGFEQISIRHSKFATNRFAHQAAPALERFADSSPAAFVSGMLRDRIAASS